MAETKTAEQVVKSMFNNSIPSWWSRSGNTYDLLLSFGTELSEAFTNNDGLHSEVHVETATGSYLDAIGKLFRLARFDEETDDNVRARIKAYWQAFSNGGTADGIVLALSVMTGIDTSDIAVNEQQEYMRLFMLDDCEATAAWAATNDANNLTLDTTTVFEGKGCLNFDANAGTDITVKRTASAFDFTDYATKHFGYRFYIPNLTSFTRLQIKFLDSAASYKTYYYSNVSEIGWQEVYVDLSATADASSGTLDWTDITDIEVGAIYSGAVAYTDFRTDFLTLDSYDYNMQIKVTFTIGPTFDLTILNGVTSVVNNAKAAGVYFEGDGDILIESEDSLFMTNVSEVNGIDNLG